MSTLSTVSTVRFADEAKLNNFKHLKIRVVPETNTAWLYFDPKPRPCYSLTLLKELDEFQSILRQHQGKLPCNRELVDIHYSVITSNNSVFSFGGDLDLFVNCIHKNDKDALWEYAKYAIDAVYYNHIGREFDITTISLIHGNALGGGFEAALSSHVLIAEKKADMGLPEVLFNLFPGMGAYNLLAQRLNPVQAEKMIMSGRMFHAEELYEKGIVDILAEDGEGETAVNSYLRTSKKHQNTMNAIRKVRQLANPVDYQQLIEIGKIWVDSALSLSDKDLRTMSRLVRSQVKFSEHVNEIPENVNSLYR